MRAPLGPLIVCVFVILLFTVIRVLRHAYHNDATCSIERQLAELRRGDTRDDDDDDDSGSDEEEKMDEKSQSRDRATERTREHRRSVKNLRSSLAVDVDALPPVMFQAVKNSHGAADKRGNQTDIDEAEERVRQRDCLSSGVYVSPVNDFIDCRTYCRVSDGVEYKYISVRNRLLRYGRLSRVGGYCLPTVAARCNTTTSLVVYGRIGWRCQSQMRAFAGEGGNRIVACDGSLLDRATGVLWRDYIDPTLRFDSVDEALADGTPRFVCPSDSRDRLGNARLVSPYDRLQLIDNHCASLIPYAETRAIRLDFERGRCICDADHSDEAVKYYRDPHSAACLPFPSRAFDERTFEATLTTTHCIDVWSRASYYAQMSAEERARLTVCGVAHGDEYPIGSDPAVVRVRAQAFDRVVPSSAAMIGSRRANE